MLAHAKYYPVDAKFFTLNSTSSTATKMCADELKWVGVWGKMSQVGQNESGGAKKVIGHF